MVFIIRLENVTYTYPNQESSSIKNINITIKKGEIVVLTGNSGCGKTTITRVINGLATKFYYGKLEGCVEVDGKNIDDLELWQLGKKIGSIFQDPKSQFFASLAEDEVAFGCENYGIERELINNRVNQAIHMINGENLLGKELFYLSSGEKQKVAIASVYALNPDIYVFDEPSANLDMYSVEKLRELLLKLKSLNKTIIISEHRLYYLKELADRYIYLENGEIKKEWTKDKIESISEKERTNLGLRAFDLKNIKNYNFKLPIEEKTTIHIKNLNFCYKNQKIYEKLNLSFYKNSIIAITGKNGVGKTTLAKILCGLINEQKGNIFFNGNTLKASKRINYSYFVMKNTECQLFAESVSKELELNDKKVNTKENLSRYGLENLENLHPSVLSGGQKQRLTLAVSDTINRPVVILDEPTSGVDYKNMILISNRLKDIKKKGKIIIVISHDYEFILETCDRAIFMEELGEVLEFNLETQRELLLEKMIKTK